MRRAIWLYSMNLFVCVHIQFPFFIQRAGDSEGYRLFAMDQLAKWRVLTFLISASFLPAGDSEGYRLYTMDHDTGSLRLDLAHAWADPARPSPVTPEEELICDPSSGWLCSRVDCSME